MHITLRPGEKLYLNGAVLRADRKVSLELMNDAVFLLEAHVMHPDKATTPLRQLYFVIQSLLMSPDDTAVARGLFADNLGRMARAYTHPDVLEALGRTEALVAAARYFEALKGLRALFATDDALLGRAAATKVACSQVVSPQVACSTDALALAS